MLSRFLGLGHFVFSVRVERQDERKQGLGTLHSEVTYVILRHRKEERVDDVVVTGKTHQADLFFGAGRSPS